MTARRSRRPQSRPSTTRAVVLDANCIIADYRLRDAASTALLQQSATRLIQLVIPRLVIEEAVNDFGEELQKSVTTLRRNARALARFGVVITLPAESVDDLRVSYEVDLLRRLESHRAIIQPYPSVAHEDVAQRAIARRQPFNQQGQGYRDTLIWHNVLELVANSEVWFITRDKDYLTDDDLSEALLQDLDQMTVPRERLRRFPTIEECVTALVEVEKEAVARITTALRRDAAFVANLSDQIGTSLSYFELDVGTLPGPEDNADQAWIDTVEDIVTMSLRDVRHMAPDEYLVRLEVLCEASIELLIHKSEAATVEVDAGRRFRIADWNWNQSFVQAYSDVRITAEVGAIVRESDLAISHIDVDVVSADRAL